MRRFFWLFVVVITAIFAGTPLFGAEKVRVGYPALGTALSPSWVTADKGFWKKRGLDVELILLRGGSQTLAALLSGSIQIIIGSDTGVALGILRGMDLVKLGVTTNSLGSSLVTRHDIGSIKDLKGKIIGISRGGGASYAQLAKEFKDNGIDPRKGVKLLNMGGGQLGRLSSLKAGVIDGTMLFPPLELLTKKQGLKIVMKFDVPSIAGGINTMG